jgi:hypothetical protein
MHLRYRMRWRRTFASAYRIAPPTEPD